MLRVENLNQFYGESHTLWNLSLALKERSCTALLGRNGAGKTTLLKCIMGLLPSESGLIEFNDRRIDNKRSDIRAKLGIGYVPQGREIFPQLTVEENLQLCLGARSDRAKEIPRRIFDLFPILKDLLKRRGGDLSGGQQQQLAIARALVIEPKLLLLDEATEGVQPNIVEEIRNVVRYINREEGVAVLIVTLRLEFARSIADQFYLLDKGRIGAQGNIADLSDELGSEFLSI